MENFSGIVNFTNSPYELYKHDRIDKYVILSFHVVITLISVIGNGTLLKEFLLKQTNRNIGGILVFTMALADFAFTLTALPVSFIYYLERTWHWGVWVCRAVISLKDVTEGVTVLSLIGLSIYTYNSLQRSFKGKVEKHVKIGLPLGIVTLALVNAGIGFTRYQIFNSQEQGLNLQFCHLPNKHFCIKNELNFRMVVHKFIGSYVIPLCIIGMFCGLIIKKIVRPGDNEKASEQECLKQPRTSLATRQTNGIVVVTIVIAFVFCTLPLKVYKVWFTLETDSLQQYNELWYVFRTIGYCLTLTKCIVNPVVFYCLKNFAITKSNHTTDTELPDI